LHFLIKNIQTALWHSQPKKQNYGMCAVAFQDQRTQWLRVASSGVKCHGTYACLQITEHGGSFLHRIKDRRRRAILEGQIGHLLVHPNIVSTFACYSGPVPVEKLTLPHLRGSKPLTGTRHATLQCQEYCSAGSLRSALDSGLLESNNVDGQEGISFHWFRTVAQVAAQVATGVAYAHSCGVLHCDLKADNILLQPLSDDQRFPGMP
jgi:serine/threonine protein kinase